MSKDKRIEHFEVKPGSSVKLDRVDTDYHGGYPSEASAAADTVHHRLRITSCGASNRLRRRCKSA